MTRSLLAITIAACTSSSTPPTTSPDASPSPVADAAEPATSGVLGTVSAVHDVACAGAPAGSTCKQVTVTGCAGIETAALDAIVAILPGDSATQGTIAHFSGGGGTSYNTTGLDEYRAAHFQQVFVRWLSDWEITPAQGIKTAGCRPATVMRWIFDELHGGNRALGFCVEGHSGGSAQIGYALAQYGMADYIDYANEISGPPFARIDLGCDGDAPQSQLVCGDQVTTSLRGSALDLWENIEPPASCGGTNIPAAELARWKADSIAVGGTYSYPKTEVEFFDCTSAATAVTAMSRYYYEAIAAASGSDPARAGYRCYSEADGCHGEGLGPIGAAAATQAMLDGCVARHQ